MKVNLTVIPKTTVTQVPVSELSYGDRFKECENGIEYEVAGSIKCDGEVVIVLPVDRPINYVRVKLVKFFNASHEVKLHKIEKINLKYIPIGDYFFTPQGSLHKKLIISHYDKETYICEDISTQQKWHIKADSIVIPAVINYINEEE